PVPPKVVPGAHGAPPSDALVLFDGRDLDQWISAVDSTAAPWILNAEGSMTVKDRSGDIQTKRDFGSVQLHLEWRSPAQVQGTSQSRANSGVFLNGLYEIQVLDNNDNDTYTNGQVGSLYTQYVPLAMAAAATGKWITYDIFYGAPHFEKG